MEKLEHKFEPLGQGADAVRLKGAVDVFTYKELKSFIEAYAKDRQNPRLYVDMSQVSYVGSSGWSVFFLQASALEKQGGALCLGALNERTQRALDMIAPRKGLILTASTEAEALSLLAQHSPAA
jgi:anti-anti-sigma factor